MLDKVAPRPAPHERFTVGSKSLSLDAVWAQPPIAEIEVALLRNAAFPELARDDGVAHEFVLIDPSTSPHHLAHADLAHRIAGSAARLKIQTVVIGHAGSDEFGTGGFPASVHELAAMAPAAFALGAAQLRERVGWLVAGARFSRRRHLFFPACDATLFSAVVETVAALPAAARPFVHLATWWDAAAMPNAARFPGLARVGAAVAALNAERPTTFLYAWSRPLAQRLTDAFGQPVAALDVPPELALAEPGEPSTERLVVGFLSAPNAAAGFDLVPDVVRAANRAAGDPRRIRFVVQVRPPPDGPLPAPAATRRAELAGLPGRNVSLIDEHLPRPAFFAALRGLDALVLPLPHEGERFSVTALHAMAAGKLIFALDGTSFCGVSKNRVVTAAEPRALGEAIAETAMDVAAVRTAARVAKSTWWATLRPSRLFAQLLYGPLILAGASGADRV